MAEFDVAKLLPLADLLADRAARAGDAVYAIFPDASITYGELYRRAAAIARGLIAAGLRPGEHVAILMPNCLEFMLAHYAVQLAGGRSILLNARFKRHELAHVLAHTDNAMLITTDCIDAHVNFAALLEETFPELADASPQAPLLVAAAPLLRRVFLFGARQWAPALSESGLVALGKSVSDADLAAAHAGADVEATAVMIYTSGTTAMPKACELSAASLQRSWRIFTWTVGLQPGEKLWDPMPFFHSGGIGLMTGIMAAGATILSTPHYDPEQVAALIEQHRVEHLYPGFHTILLPLLQSRGYSRERWSAFVKSAVNVGPLGTQYVLRDMLPPGIPVINLFGMSESSGVLTYPPLHSSEDLRLTSSGLPLYGAEVRIADPETLAVLPPDQRGEIQFRGAGAFRGYYNDPAATRATILDGGWVRTGDLGRIDRDGYLFYLGRLKDMLKVGGENVAAAEVESFLSAHPAVKFVQVIGRPDAHLGEVPVAFVELNPGAAASEADIIAFCTGQIARFRIPRQVVFVTEWPMSATKIQKFRLRELLSK